MMDGMGWGMGWFGLLVLILIAWVAFRFVIMEERRPLIQANRVSRPWPMAGLDLSVGEGSYEAGGDPYPIWSPDARRLYVTLGDKARLHGYAVDTRSGRATRLLGGDRMVEFLAPAGDGRRLVFGLSDAARLSDVHVAAADGSGIRRLTRPHAARVLDHRERYPERDRRAPRAGSRGRNPRRLFGRRRHHEALRLTAGSCRAGAF